MYGYEIEAVPSSLSGTSVFARFVDGLAFRYHWATEGLRDTDVDFRPGPDSMTLRQLLQHVLHLACMVEQTVMNASERRSVDIEDAAALRERTLTILAEVRAFLDGLDDESFSEHRVLKRSGKLYPVWNIMNGPLADALTHVGQINAWRRLAGNPTPPADVFGGRPPRERG